MARQITINFDDPKMVGRDAPAPHEVGRPNEIGGRTSVKKLNGVVYTPLALARSIVARMPLQEGAVWLDPACGEGVFLIAALERAATAGVSIHVEGWDIDGGALTKAHANLQEAKQRLRVDATWTLTHRDAMTPESRRFDIVVGNPPYLEAKRMPDDMKARVKAACPVSSTGAFDLYAAFVELSARLLTSNGVMAFIVPNRIAVTTNADGIRRWMLEQGRITVIDLSKSTPFPDAAVYPMIVELHRGESSELVTTGFESSECERFSASLLNDRLSGRWPLPSAAAGGELVRRVLVEVPQSLGEFFDIRWTVSFHASGLRDKYVFKDRPNTPHARKFVGGGKFSGNREVDRFAVKWAGWWIDYDEERARRDRNTLPPVELFVQPKVAICQNARRCRAAVDLDGHVLKDTFLLATVRPGIEIEFLYWLSIVLHSRLFHICYDVFNGGTRKGGGYLHFLGSYLLNFPFPPPPAGFSPSTLYRRLLEGDAGMTDIENIVGEAYGVTSFDAAWLHSQSVPDF
jgi:tRNA1(Val) A37 N6-methylase TrmN6